MNLEERTELTEQEKQLGLAGTGGDFLATQLYLIRADKHLSRDAKLVKIAEVKARDKYLKSIEPSNKLDDELKSSKKVTENVEKHKTPSVYKDKRRTGANGSIEYSIR